MRKLWSLNFLLLIFVYIGNVYSETRCFQRGLLGGEAIDAISPVQEKIKVSALESMDPLGKEFSRAPFVSDERVTLTPTNSEADIIISVDLVDIYKGPFVMAYTAKVGSFSYEKQFKISESAGNDYQSAKKLVKEQGKEIADWALSLLGSDLFKVKVSHEVLKGAFNNSSDVSIIVEGEADATISAQTLSRENGTFTMLWSARIGKSDLTFEKIFSTQTSANNDYDAALSMNDTKGFEIGQWVLGLSDTKLKKVSLLESMDPLTKKLLQKLFAKNNNVDVVAQNSKADIIVGVVAGSVVFDKKDDRENTTLALTYSATVKGVEHTKEFEGTTSKSNPFDAMLDLIDNDPKFANGPVDWILGLE